jgi:hypothetical protein
LFARSGTSRDPQTDDLFRPQRLDRIHRGSSLRRQKRGCQRDRCKHHYQRREKLPIALRLDLSNCADQL